MRLLHVTPEPPLVPDESGGMIRQARLLAHLIGLGHEVTLVACVSAAQEPGLDALRDAGARVVTVPRPAARTAALALGARRRPAHLLDAAREPWTPWKLGFMWALMRETARRELTAGRPDVVVVEHDVAAGWSADLAGAAPVVLGCQNVTWAAVRTRAALAGGARRAALDLEARRLRAHAARHLPRHAALIAVSEADRARLVAVSPLPCTVVPNGAAFEEIAESDPATGPPALLFTGTMSHPPNADGARWLAREVWPLVRREQPRARLIVAGRHPPASVTGLASEPGVEVTGAVASMAPYYAQAHVVAVPVRSGGGTRLKALEAFATGRPVVATTFGVEGIDGLVSGRHLLLADDPQAFASAVLGLFADPRRGAQIGAAARALLSERYDWRASGDALAGALERVVARG